VLLGLGLRRPEIPDLLTAEMLKANRPFMALAQGAVPQLLPTERELIRLFQRALQAVGARVTGAPRELLLSQWGTDGDLGEETLRAVAALQKWQGHVGTPGRVGSLDAAALVRTLASAHTPDLWAPQPPSQAVSGPARRIVEIARGICQATPERPFSRRVDGRVYSYSAEDFGVMAKRNGTLRAPGGVAYSLSQGREYWKCNIFGGMCLALAEVPVPTFEYAPGSPRHFPRAERFGERLAQKPGWKQLFFLDHRDPQNPTQSLTGAQQDSQVRELLLAARPGDMLFVDHPGEPGDEGGHTRVCTEAAAPGDANLAPMFAQARYDKAQEQRDGLDLLAGGRELCFWLLRYA
jgi:peptidoglycan hydrolase-like protein with peptidoglycan-binding domain